MWIYFKEVGIRVSNVNTHKSIYYNYCHSIIKYGIILLGYRSNGWDIFILQKKIVRIMAVSQPRNFYRSQFKIAEILPFPCHYILSLMNFIAND